MKYLSHNILVFFLSFTNLFAMDNGDSTPDSENVWKAIENIDTIFSVPTLKKLMELIKAQPELTTMEFTRQCIADKLKELDIIKREIQPIMVNLDINLDLINGEQGINTRTPDTGYTALSRLMWLIDPDVGLVEKMLQNSADPNIPDRKGNTALKHIMSNLQYETDRSNQEKCKKIIELLVYYGASPEIENVYGVTPFSGLVYLKVASGMIEIAELFLKAGVNINRVNSQGNTPLMHALYNFIGIIKEREQNQKIKKRLPSTAFIKFLLDHGADPNKPNRIGHTPLALVASSETLTNVDSLLNLLLRKGAQLGSTNI